MSTEHEDVTGEMEAAGYPKAEREKHPLKDNLQSICQTIRTSLDSWVRDRFMSVEQEMDIEEAKRKFPYVAPPADEAHVDPWIVCSGTCGRNAAETGGYVRGEGFICGDCWMRELHCEPAPINVRLNETVGHIEAYMAKQSPIDFTAALKIVAEVHGSHRDQGGEPYWMHLARVAAAMDTDEERLVAWLHDALEDCPEGSFHDIAKQIIQAYGMTIFSACMALNHFKGEDYLSYLERLSTNDLALRVKLSDCRDNGDPKRLAKLAPHVSARLSIKYAAAHQFLMTTPTMAGLESRMRAGWDGAEV